MREALRKLGELPDHRGLAHDVWAPFAIDQRSGDPGKIHRDLGEEWFEKLCSRYQPRHYDRALARWTQSLTGPDDLAFHASTRGRLLVGHGNAAPSEVGITLHRTWGVPVIPGSSLAGLLAHYVAATLGPTDALDAEREACEPFRPSPRDEDGNATGAPGDAYAYLFGVPPHRDDQGELRAQRGALIVHDALWVPQGDDTPLARDVLTVHQRSYYDGKGWPSDHDSPNPVAFVSVPVRARFVFGLTCPDAGWRQWVFAQLCQALTEWGIGGKTAAGYGRFDGFSEVRVSEHPLERELGDSHGSAAGPEASTSKGVSEHPLVSELGEALEARKQQRATSQELLDWLAAEWIPRLRDLDPQQHELVARLLRKYVTSRKKAEQRDRLLGSLRRAP